MRWLERVGILAALVGGGCEQDAVPDAGRAPHDLALWFEDPDADPVAMDDLYTPPDLQPFACLYGRSACDLFAEDPWCRGIDWYPPELAGPTPDTTVRHDGVRLNGLGAVVLSPGASTGRYDVRLHVSDFTRRQGLTPWLHLVYASIVPPGATLEVRVRAADGDADFAKLDTLPWAIDTVTCPIALSPVLPPMNEWDYCGNDQRATLEVEFTLRASPSGQSPTLQGFSASWLQWSCGVG